MTNKTVVGMAIAEELAKLRIEHGVFAGAHELFGTNLGAFTIHGDTTHETSEYLSESFGLVQFSSRDESFGVAVEIEIPFEELGKPWLKSVIDVAVNSVAIGDRLEFHFHIDFIRE